MNTIRENAPAGHIENNIKAFMAGWNAVDNVPCEPRDKVANELEEAATLG
jgi:Pyruvate/2-oxoacid:ferredoxin oxidoreductase gamma subunit